MRWQRQGCRERVGRPGSLGLGLWVQGRSSQDTARQKPTIAFTLFPTPMCTHRSVQPSKHKPLCIPTGHTHPKTYNSHSICKAQYLCTPQVA